MNNKKICGILIACAAFATFNHAASAQQDSARQDIKRDAKATGKDIGHGARDVGHATKHVAIKIGHGAKEAGHGIAHGAREGWDATKHALKHVFQHDD
ncbi:MAG: hypothetical protein ACYCZD_01675 [Rhodanobacter sp.]